MSDYKQAEAVLQRHAARLMAFPHVVSVGLGYRQRGAEETDELCISIGVDRKLAAEELPDGGALPESIEGVPVDVVETGRVEAL